MNRIIPPIDGISNKNTPKYVSVDITVEDNKRILTVSANSDFLNRQGVVIESKGRLEDAEKHCEFIYRTCIIKCQILL